MPPRCSLIWLTSSAGGGQMQNRRREIGPCAAASRKGSTSTATMNSSAPLCWPPGRLDSSVSVGWQHRRYESKIDPKVEIAEEVMGALQKSSISYCFQEDQEDNIRAGLGGDCSDDDRDKSFTPHTGWYSAGPGNMVYAVAGELDEPDLTACGLECGYCGRCKY